MRTIIQLFNTGVLVITGNMFIYSQNLIQNSSFEQGGQPWGNYWYARQDGSWCGEITNTTTDTVCGLFFMQDAPPGGGIWSLASMMTGGAAISYYFNNLLPNQVFQFSFWSKGSCNNYLNISFYSASLTYGKGHNIALINNQWIQYLVFDTLPSYFSQTDTLILEISTWCSNDFGGYIIDSITFNIVDTITTYQHFDLQKNDIFITLNANNGFYSMEIINTGNIHISKTELYNIFGQRILINELATNTFEFHIKDGIYIIRVFTENEIITKKLIIQ